MADNQWGEIFNLTEELKRIEDEVDRRLEETLAEDPHVIEQETVHYGAAAAAADRAEEFRMRQSVPLFGVPSGQPVGDPGVMPGGPAGDAAPDMLQADAGDMAAGPQEADAGETQTPAEVLAAAAVFNEGSVDDYSAPLAAESPQEDRAQEETDGIGEPESYDGAAVPTEAAEAEAEEIPAAQEFPAEEGQPAAKIYAFAGPEMVRQAVPTMPMIEDTERADDGQDAMEPVEAQDEEPAFTEDAAPQQTPVEEPAWESAQRQEQRTPTRRVVPAPEMDGPMGPDEIDEPDDLDDLTETDGASLFGDRRRILVILIAIILLLAAILGYWYYQGHVVKGRQYAAAEALYKSGDYDAAVAAFTEIRSYKDAESRILEVEYAKASSLVDQKAYAAAVEYVDNLSNPTDAMLTLRSHAIYELALLYYKDGDLGNAEGELLMIQGYEEDGVKAVDLLHEIQYKEASNALAIYDYETAEPILASLGDYEDAAILLEQVENAIDVVLTDVALDDSGKEIEGKTQYLWVHSVITPGAIAADAAEEETAADAESAADTESTAQSDGTGTIAALRQLAGATDAVDDAAVHVLMMHMATTDAEMTYEDADPIETDSSTIITKDVSSYAAIDDTFGSNQTVYSPQVIQRSNTDYALAFDGSASYASKERKGDEVVMECKMADDGYWVKTRRVYAELEDDRFIGVSRHQLRTWTKVLNESLADEVRAAFVANMSEQ